MDVIKGATKRGPKAGTGAGSLGPSASNGTKSSGSAAGSGQGSGSKLGLGLGGSSKGGEMMAERSSRRIAASSRDPTHPSDLPPAPPQSSTQAPLTVSPVLPPPASTAVTSTASAPVRKPFRREPSVPSEVPKTLYEFERAWRGLKDRPDLFAQYLRQNIREKSVFRKVFKESISPDLLSAVFLSLRDHCTAVFSYSFLLSLSTVRHFSMTLALLQEEDLQCVRAILSKERVTDASIEGEAVRESIAQLKLLYKI
jgi:Potential Monad-binding region of RPAP3